MVKREKSATVFLKFVSTFVLATLSINTASIAYSDEIEPVTISCFTSGSITIQDTTLISSDSCTGSVEIPLAVTQIADAALSNASALTAVTFEADSLLQTIGTGAFQGTGLTEITIPASVTAIGDQAFANTPSLTSFTVTD